MMFVLLLLVGVICTYWVLTDARRVRGMAENYLSRLTGGTVHVKGATLSIFEGLRLDGVSVSVDGRDRADSQIFRAGTIQIKYDPQSILSGRLEATQIVAMDPQVFLCEDLDRGKWNWERAGRPEQPATRQTPGPPLKFPEILLRNARLTYGRLRGGAMLADRGSMEIEGILSPASDGAISFNIQSRGGEAEAIGPAVEGQFNLGSKVVRAKLRHFSFGKDIEVMLPEQVRQWWVAHGLSGSLDIPNFSITPGKDGQKSRFYIETDLKNVNLDINPEEWLSREEGLRLAAMRDTVALMKAAGLDASGFTSELESMFNPTKVELDKVAGRFVFTQDGIDIKGVSGWVEKNPFMINGHIDGYKPEAAATITFDGQNITIPHAPRYVNAMPGAFRELYEHLRPEGDGSVWVQITRPAPGAKPVVTGRIDIIDGTIRFDEFPYPLRAIKGVIGFGWDEKSKMDRVDVELHGRGVADGPNRNVPVEVRGFVGPLGSGEAEFDFWVKTNGVTNEPALTAAYPAPVREALKIFDTPGRGEFPRYQGGFVANVHRAPGPKQKWAVKVDVDLTDAQGQLTFFPYPVDHLTGHLTIFDDHVDLVNIAVKKADAALAVDGTVRFGKDQPIDPTIKISAHNLPIDQDLLGALPKDRRAWLEKIGLAGKVDVEGTIKREVGARASAGARRPEDDITYDMNLALKDGAFYPIDGAYAATAVTGTLRVTPTELVVTDLRGRRGKGEISGSGIVSGLNGGTPGIVMTAAARNLALDAPLYKMLPPAWRGGWDQARPEGTVDLDLSYRDSIGEQTASAATPAVAIEPPAATPPAATTRPVGGFAASIRPVKLSMTPRVIPVRLDDVKGEILIRPEGITLENVTATRKSGGTVAYAGSVPAGEKKDAAWELTLSAKDIATDKELRAALPGAVSRLLDSMKVQGRFSADFTKLSYRADPDPAVEDGQLDFAGTLTLPGNAFDFGVPVTDAVGTISLKAAARRGKLAGLVGTVDLASLNLGGRPITEFRCDLIKPESDDALRIGKVAGKVAGGALAGQVDLLFPDQGPSRFGLGLVLRNADVRELTGPTDKEKDIKGSLSASLSLEGNWGDAGSRRGRGDVSVSGKEMYKIPLVLGLMQITNLSLPISSPFNEAAARYSVEGERINFEQVELRASNMLMSGNGWLDFKSKKVKMTFVTDNPNAWRIPFLSDILQGARQELMQIHVTGSVKEPKVSGAMMNTFTTTVDEVFDKNGGKGQKK